MICTNPTALRDSLVATSPFLLLAGMALVVPGWIEPPAPTRAQASVAPSPGEPTAEAQGRAALPPEERRLPTRIRAARTTALAFEVSGRLAAKSARRGEELAADDLILRLDDTLAGLARSEAQTQLEIAREANALADRELQRAQPLKERGTLEDSAFDALESRARIASLEVRQAELRLLRTEEQLRRHQLRAPSAGWLAECHPEVGEQVQAGRGVATLLSLRDPVLELFVDAAERRALAARPEAAVFVQLLSVGRRIPGRIRELAEASEGESFRVVIALDPEHPEVRIGESAELIIPGVTR